MTQKNGRTSEKPGLLEFARSQKPCGVECFLCSIPEREEVEQAILTGQVTKAAALRWLRDVRGYEQAASQARISNHMDRHVKRPA